MESSQFLIVGLGNPGREYALTRHNMGYLVVQALAQVQGWSFKEESSFHAMVAKGKVDQMLLHLMLPLTYMNESGRAVRRYLDFYKLKPEQLIVVTDDTAIDYGQMRVRSTGSAGGHNGLKSIQAHLQTQDYVRVRMGIGQRTPTMTLADYVLDTFSPEERQQLPAFVERGVGIVQRLIREPISTVMNSVNLRRGNSESRIQNSE
jgi:PTH1 family peptidyl-tRNA hydrolase